MYSTQEAYRIRCNQQFNLLSLKGSQLRGEKQGKQEIAMKYLGDNLVKVTFCWILGISEISQGKESKQECRYYWTGSGQALALNVSAILDRHPTIAIAPNGTKALATE